MKPTTGTFNTLRNREKWDTWKDQSGKWKCPGCKAELTDGPHRASPFTGCSIHCEACDYELSHRTGGGQNDPFEWILEEV